MPTFDLVDTHCHLDFNAFDDDRDDVIQRAVASGVRTLLNPSVDLGNSQSVADLAAKHPSVFAAIGVHPNDSLVWGTGSPDELRKLAAHKKVVALGEIGLDYYWDKAPKDVQQKVFRAQLDLAAELELPVIVHNREASADVISMLLAWQTELIEQDSPLAARPGVLHSFSGDRDMAEKAIAANFLIGFTGPLTFKNAKELQTLASAIPLDHLLIETDSPFLSPHPERGQRNEPAKVVRVAEKLAELKGTTTDEVAAVTTANAERLFRFEAHQ